MKSDTTVSFLPGPSAARIARMLVGVFTVYTALVSVALLVVWETPWGVAAVKGPQRVPLLIALLAHGAAAILCGLGYVWVRYSGRVRPIVPCLAVAAAAPGLVVSLDLLIGVVVPPFVDGSPIFLLHPVRGWTNRPSHTLNAVGVTVVTDSRGMRVDEDRPDAIETGKTPILFVGDSITAGWGVRYREIFLTRMVELLNRRHPTHSICALNGGTSGYDTRQEYDWLSHEGLALKPRLVVLQFCLNDVFSPFDPQRMWDSRSEGEYLRPSRPLSWSGIGRAIWLWQRMPNRKTGLIEDGTRSEWFGVSECLAVKESAREAKAWPGVLHALDQFVGGCRAAGTPMVLVCFPVNPQVSDRSAGTRTQDRLDQWARRKGVPYLDLLPNYREALQASAEPIMMDLTHPTARGHQVAAEALASLIEKAGFLESDSSQAISVAQ